MARIKAAHLRQLLSKYAQEKITFQKIVETLNAIANEPELNCKKCGKELEPYAIKKSSKCVACFTSNA